MAKRAPRPAVGITWIVTWPLLVVFGAMVFLTSREIGAPVHEAAPPIEETNWEARLPERIAVVTAVLQQSALHLSVPVEEPKGSGSLRWIHRRFDLSLPRAQWADAEAAIRALTAIDSGATVAAESTADGAELQIGLDGLLTHTLRVRWNDPAARPRVAVVIDALGDDLRIARAGASLEAPIAFAVRPFRPFSKETAELGRLFKREVLLHVMSEAAATEHGDGPAGQPNADRGLAAALESVPHAVGIMLGAAPGRAAGADSAIEREATRRGLFSVGGRVLPELPGQGEPAALIALDAGGDRLSDQIAAFVETARQAGAAVAIAHADEATVEALRSALDQWRAAGVDVVPVSALVAPVALSAR